MIARARPLLGTMVSIRADASEAAVKAAFSDIRLVHELMSVHIDSSDLARIRREAHLRPVRVHRWTYAVLSCAKSLSNASLGLFDITLRREGASHSLLSLLPGYRVSLRRPAWLDLGGIAKGFAVDRAVAALRRRAATSGSVNAGGDLRLFGTIAQKVRVRLPNQPGMAIDLDSRTEGAFATSGSYFGEGPLDLATGRSACEDKSITIAAPSCMIADALTKITAAAGPIPALLRRYRATAYLIDGNGALYAARP